MNALLDNAEDVFLDRINRICNKFGLNNIMAQLYAILYFSDTPLSLDDMVDRLKISKGSVSLNIRALERYGAVRQVWVKGSRKDFYEAETDIAKVITDRIRSMARSRLSEVDDMIRAAYDLLGSPNARETGGAKTKVFKERLDRLKELHSKAQNLFDVFNSNILDMVVADKTNV